MSEVIIVAIIGAVSASVVTPLVQYLVSKLNKKDAMHDGVCLILQDKVKYLTQCAVADGEISLSQKVFIHKMIDTAHELGANGEMTECGNIIDSLNVIS